MNKPMQFLMEETVAIPSARMPGYVLDLIEVRDSQWETETAQLRAERDELRAALARIVGMCGEVDRCKCGRLTGIAAITTCARAALSRTEGEGIPGEES